MNAEAAAEAATKHVVASVDEIAPGGRKRVEVEGRGIVVFNLEGEFYALLDHCPHAGGPLSKGRLAGVISSDGPGDYCLARPGEMIKCPWHGWEFDIKTGQSWCDPARIRARKFEVDAEDGAALVKGPYKAETIDVTIENRFVVITI